MEKNFAKNMLLAMRKATGGSESERDSKSDGEGANIEPCPGQDPCPDDHRDHRRVVVFPRLRFPRLLKRRRL